MRLSTRNVTIGCFDGREFADEDGICKLAISTRAARCSLPELPLSDDTPLSNLTIANIILPLWPGVDNPPPNSPSLTERYLYGGNNTLDIMNTELSEDGRSNYTLGLTEVDLAAFSMD